MMNIAWIVAAVCLACASASGSEAIESSMSADSDFQSLASSFRFLGITKTMATTTTVVSTKTVYVHTTCIVTFPNVGPCSDIPPTTTRAPTTTTTPATTTTTKPTTTTTKPTTTTSKPLFQIITGSSRPVLTGTVTFNKVEAPKLQVNLPDFLGGGTLGGGKANGTATPGNNNNNNGILGVIFNKPPVNINVGGSVSASVSGGRRRRSNLEMEDSSHIQPSLVRIMEVTASPELTLSDEIQPEVILEASRDDEYQEYAIMGLENDFYSERASMPFFGKKMTIVRLDRVTVTDVKTVTSTYPTKLPSDRVTVAYLGCIPKDAPTNLALCNP